MEPKAPDPVLGAKLLNDIPGRVEAAARHFRQGCARERRVPDWREFQIQWFIKYIGLYSTDLGQTYGDRRADSLAQAMRNLLELRVWVRYCALSDEDAKRFFDDGIRDLREIMETFQKVYTRANKEPQKRIDDILAEMKTKAPAFNVNDYESGYLRVNDAAAKIGEQQEHSAFYKIASKFAHPTAVLLAMQDPGARGMLDSLFEVGAKLADSALRDMEGIVQGIYPDLDAV